MSPSRISRRQFLNATGALARAELAGASLRLPCFGLGLPLGANFQPPERPGQSTHCTLRPRPLRSLPNESFLPLHTTGSFRGRCFRFKEGRPVTVDIHMTPIHRSNCIGTVKEFQSTLMEPPRRAHRSFRRTASGIAFTPNPAGFRFYHTHNRAGGDLKSGQYGGEVGPVYIESKLEPGSYDREVFLVLKEFEPKLSMAGTWTKISWLR